MVTITLSLIPGWGIRTRVVGWQPQASYALREELLDDILQVGPDLPRSVALVAVLEVLVERLKAQQGYTDHCAQVSPGEIGAQRSCPASSR